MDNLCHTLAGLAMGQAGLKRRTPLGNLTLMLASNLPDVDVLVFATEVPSVAFRRGWTHGVLAQALLPLAFAALMFWLTRGRRAGDRPVFGGLLLLSYIGVLAHVYMDLLNNYGVRLLMPFSNRWFYGDSVFIIDLWLWLLFGVGAWIAARRGSSRPARVAVLLAVLYIGALVVSARAAREPVAEAWRLRAGSLPRSLMVGPLPITPFRRAVIVDAGASYATGTFDWWSSQVTFDGDVVPKHHDHPAVRAAVARDARFRAVLVWARFPYYEVENAPGATVVRLRDLRFGDRVGGVTTTVTD